MKHIAGFRLLGFATLGFSIIALTLSLVLQSPIVTAAEERYEKLQIFSKVLNLVQQYYVETVNIEKLIYGGIKGMLGELDPHTNFLPPDIFKEFESETSGEFGGIGIEIGIQGDVLTIISPIEDTPAWNAGIKAGDRIVEVNGEPTKGLSLVEAAQKMRGKLGTPVKLGIMREGFEKPKEFSIVRGTVKLKSVKYTDLDDGFGYLRITSFVEKTADDMEKILKDHEKKHKDIRGLILDLRNNPGGLLDQAVRLSDAFLESGTIVSTIGRNQKEKEVLYAKKEGTRTGFPIVILINEYSASASEILAGALQDNKRGVVVGKRSFGKGSVQSVVKLGDGSGLKLTVARYFTPSGRSIQAEGIQPDVILDEVNPELFEKAVVKRKVRREKDIRGHLAGESEKSDPEDEDEDVVPSEKGAKGKADATAKNLSTKDALLKGDYQIAQAFNYLKTWKVFKVVQ